VPQLAMGKPIQQESWLFLFQLIPPGIASCEPLDSTGCLVRLELEKEINSI